jgi:hypothetical protein
MARDFGSEGGPGGRPEERSRRSERERAEPLRGPNPLGAGIPSTLLGRDPGEGRIADFPSGGQARRGPKGWRRTDDRILDELAESVARSGVDAADVELHVSMGVVRLTGTVEHREDRRMLEALAWDVHGVEDVEERLRVRRR